MTSRLYDSILTNNDIILKYKSLPNLNIGKRNGMTDYIDFIPFNEVNAMAKGTDCFGRKFIVIKCVIANRPIMQTFFQRYSDSTSHWMGCGHATELLIDTSGGMKDEHFKLLSDLIMEKNVIIKGEHSPTSQDYINKTVFPYRHYLAAKIIKQQWRICRWNPTYTMCKTIQYKNYTDIINSLS